MVRDYITGCLCCCGLYIHVDRRRKLLDLKSTEQRNIDAPIGTGVECNISNGTLITLCLEWNESKKSEKYIFTIYDTIQFIDQLNRSNRPYRKQRHPLIIPLQSG
jgi:hypothetical protein